MRILLIQPPKAAATIGGEDVYVYEPLALEYVAAGVAADHDVRAQEILGTLVARYRRDEVLTGRNCERLK